jgi:Cu2+-exporting ATPase
MPTEVTENFTNIDGQGARATIGGETVLLGNRLLMQSEQWIWLPCQRGGAAARRGALWSTSRAVAG